MERKYRPDREYQDLLWNEQKLNNRRRNEATFTGWDSGVWRRGITARKWFQKHQAEQGPNTLVVGDTVIPITYR